MFHPGGIAYHHRNRRSKPHVSRRPQAPVTASPQEDDGIFGLGKTNVKTNQPSPDAGIGAKPNPPPVATPQPQTAPSSPPSDPTPTPRKTPAPLRRVLRMPGGPPVDISRFSITIPPPVPCEPGSDDSDKSDGDSPPRSPAWGPTRPAKTKHARRRARGPSYYALSMISEERRANEGRNFTYQDMATLPMPKSRAGEIAYDALEKMVIRSTFEDILEECRATARRAAEREPENVREILEHGRRAEQLRKERDEARERKEEMRRLHEEQKKEQQRVEEEAERRKVEEGRKAEEARVEAARLRAERKRKEKEEAERKRAEEVARIVREAGERALREEARAREEKRQEQERIRQVEEKRKKEELRRRKAKEEARARQRRAEEERLRLARERRMKEEQRRREEEQRRLEEQKLVEEMRKMEEAETQRKLQEEALGGPHMDEIRRRVCENVREKIAEAAGKGQEDDDDEMQWEPESGNAEQCSQWEERRFDHREYLRHQKYEQSQAELRAQRLAQEEAERLAQEEARRLIQEAEQRAKEAERLAKEKTERLAREQAEQRAREEAVLEAQRRAQEEAQQALAIAAAFQAYDNKWNLLSKLANELSSIYFWDIPWPVFHPVTHPSQLTGDAVKQFLFWPGRPGTEDKTPRGILKNELLKWHEDKFKNTTVKRVVENEQEMAAEAGKIVNIILSNLLEEASANN